MVRRFSLLIFIGVLLTLPAPGKAEYPNPVLRILLIQTSGGVQLSAVGDLSINGVVLPNRKNEWLTVKIRGKNSLQLDDDYMVNGSAYFRSAGPIAIKLSSSSTRRYQGVIEISPGENGINIINHIRTERYLEGVLNAEISTNWPIEVVKAQSVISRTFALYQLQKKRDKAWHLTANHNDQVYKGVDVADDRGRYAIQQTTGLTVYHNGKLAQTFYHSNSGGMTEDPGNLWSTSLPYLSVKAVPYGKTDPRYRWQTSVSYVELADILKKHKDKVLYIDQVSVQARNSSNRVKTVNIVGNVTRSIPGNQFRKLVGYRKIKSLLFDITNTEDGILLSGIGNGHGVGLSQWSAKEMAEKGYSYDMILKYFYNDIDLVAYSR